MIPAIALARLCADLYDLNKNIPLDAWNFEGTICGHYQIEQQDILVFRGSFNAEDWMRDVEAFPVFDMRLGFVHAGFMTGMDDTLRAILATVGQRAVVTGHSLGGARARLLAGLLAYEGRPAVQCTVFGSPRPAFANLGRILAKSGTPLASYRNRNDPVPLVPFLADLYQHPDAWTALDAPAAPDDLEPLRDHHIARYIEGLQKLNPEGGPT